jgi:hypothetical protein
MRTRFNRHSYEYNGTGATAHGSGWQALPLIFALFVQADRAGLHSHGALARNFVETHGGTLEASSAGIGTGATFGASAALVRRASAACAERRTASVRQKAVSAQCPAKRVHSKRGSEVNRR